MHVVIFEDARWPMFAPVSLSRPVFCLASGASTLLEKQLRALNPTRLSLWVRPGLVDFCQRYVLPTLKVPTTLNEPLGHQPYLLINGRTLFASQCEAPTDFAVAMDDHGLCVAYTESPGLSPQDVFEESEQWMNLRNLPSAEPLGQTAAYLWDLITCNEASLRDDFAHLTPRYQPKPSGPYHLVNDADICFSNDVQLSPGCVIDASKGPVIINNSVVIGSNAVVQGPCSIGSGTHISPLALIRGGTTLGDRCKIGGEVSNAIFMSCSNKAHEGFVGDSYIGQWVNFGAGASTSNLKNTYGKINLRIGRHTMPTGKQFLGALIGDHTKFAISTRIMTGSYIGYCCMVAASALTPTYLPSFTFLSDSGTQHYEREKAKEMMIQVYKRRSREWETGDETLLDYLKESAASVEVP